VARVAITEDAAAVLKRLVARHGPLLFHQSGGCCDGSAPMCFPRGEFRLGERDVLLGELEGTPFYIGGQQYAVWKHTQLMIDVVPGRGSGFSLEAPLGVRFLTRSRVFDAEEQVWLEAGGGQPVGCPRSSGPAALAPARMPDEVSERGEAAVRERPRPALSDGPSGVPSPSPQP
jgi:uncharacterized protein (DUF779 family)